MWKSRKVLCCNIKAILAINFAKSWIHQCFHICPKVSPKRNWRRLLIKTIKQLEELSIKVERKHFKPGALLLQFFWNFCHWITLSSQDILYDFGFHCYYDITSWETALILQQSIPLPFRAIVPQINLCKNCTNWCAIRARVYAIVHVINIFDKNYSADFWMAAKRAPYWYAFC